jgi:hypothetical protein
MQSYSLRMTMQQTNGLNSRSASGARPVLLGRMAFAGHPALTLRSTSPCRSISQRVEAL